MKKLKVSKMKYRKYYIHIKYKDINRISRYINFFNKNTIKSKVIKIFFIKYLLLKVYDNGLTNADILHHVDTVTFYFKYKLEYLKNNYSDYFEHEKIINRKEKIKKIKNGFNKKIRKFQEQCIV